MFTIFALRNSALRSSSVIPLASVGGLVSVRRIVEGTVFLFPNSRWDSYLGMTAAMTQVPLLPHGYLYHARIVSRQPLAPSWLRVVFVDTWGQTLCMSP